MEALVHNFKFAKFCKSSHRFDISKCHQMRTWSVFYLKFCEYPSFGQVAHEIYPSEWKVNLSEISITIMYYWYMFLMAVATDFTHVTILI